MLHPSRTRGNKTSSFFEWCQQVQKRGILTTLLSKYGSPETGTLEQDQNCHQRYCEPEVRREKRGAAEAPLFLNETKGLSLCLIFVSSQVVVAVVALGVPVHTRGALALLGKLDILERPLAELVETNTVDDVANMLLALGRVGVDVLLDEGIGVLYDLHDGVLVHPAQPVLRQSRVLLARSARDLDAEVVLGAARPGTRGAVDHAHATANATVLVAHDLALLQPERAHRAALTPVHALAAANAAVGVVLGLGHANDAKVVQGHVRAVV